MLTPSTLRVDAQDQVATVWLTREAVRNAFNDTMVNELAAAFQILAQNDEVRVIVLAAQGPAFCAGADLDWMRRMATYSVANNERDALALAQMLHIIYSCPKFTIARVQGNAYAGGLGLIAACDVAVAVPSAQFCLTETKLGLIPATIAPYLIRAMGHAQARRYLVTAEVFDASTAQRLGLVHELASSEQLDACVQQFVNRILQTSASAVTEAKRLVRDLTSRLIDDALLNDTAQRIAQARASADGQEGIASFLERRSPAWVKK